MKTKPNWYTFTDDDEKFAHAFAPDVMAVVDLLARMSAKLDTYACDLSAQCADDCGVLEAQPGFEPDDFTEDEDGKPVGICYPENGSPELDHARTLLQEAIDLLAIRRDQVTAMCGASRPGIHGRGGTLFSEQDIGDNECAECLSMVECDDNECAVCPPSVKAGRKLYRGTQFEDDDDPTPWCIVCHAMTQKECDCLPFAENH